MRSDGWHKLGEYQARVRDSKVVAVALADGTPATFYKRTNRHGGDGFEPWPELGITWECAYRRTRSPTWEVRA